MDGYTRLIEIIDANLIYCLIPIILTLIIVELIFKNRFETKKVLNLVRWVMIIYTAITFAVYLIGMAVDPQEYAFVNRATGPYAILHWIMFLGALILPLSLLKRKLASKFWYVLLAAFAMKSGMYMERLIILFTSFHRDYDTAGRTTELAESATYGIGVFFVQGLVIAVVTLGVFELLKRRKMIIAKG